MASSDDEGENFPDTVSDYYFCDGEDEPLSFSQLPVQWDESESSGGNAGPIFLRGTADNGLQTLYKEVKAWKYDFLNANPKISVLSKDNNWIKLQRPRKSFENEIRTILITVNCLYFCKSKPEASGKALWDHLSKVFSLYDVRPSENDLIDHMNFIREAVKRDKTLVKSKFLAAFLEDNPRKRKVSDEEAEAATKPSFIVDDTNDEPQDDDCITKETEDSDSDEEGDVFDSVCAICDNGGELTCCEGKCLRSFHANVDIEEAEESNCESLGLPAELVKGTQPFFCENCKYNQHQCFVCGKLGSSDRSSVAEVFRCSSATCGHFYHPKCVAKLLQRISESEPQDLQEKIAAADPFTCPVHKCVVCKQAENEMVKDLQFAICRRCPTSYHRKCLPRGIMFENEVGDDDAARAWDNLLPKSRALIYCLKHEIDEELGTPARNLIFRDIHHSKKKKAAAKEKVINSEFTSKKMSVLKSQKGGETFSAVKLADASKKRAAISTGPESSKKKRVADTSKNSLKRTLSTKVKRPSANDSQPSLGSKLYDYMINGAKSINLGKDDTSVDDDKLTTTPEESLPPIDADSKKRILALMKDASSSITLDEVKRYHKEKVPSTHAHSSRVDKSIILARVEGSVEALHLALKKLEGGCSIEDAMAVCEPGVLDQIMRWKEKLRVYLAPFLHGMRYSSFGRHFTKVEKLEKIVDKLRWYVEDGDTIVDFCCGANDFSCLMKKQLDQMGKRKCSYKNYDFTRPKNDFNFEKRDWMTVSPKELPSGSRLIMGLNPPFGTRAALANKFIEKALQFKPKLLILTVPPETERLDHENKKIPYDLVWEDAELLAGKSFYLPGSVNVNDKQMDQWNITPPPLYLWSHPKWTSKHWAIAKQNGHISEAQEAPLVDENEPTSNEKKELKSDLVPLDNLPLINKDIERTTDKAKTNTKRNRKEDSARDNNNQTRSKRKQNSNKRNRRNKKYTTEKHDNNRSTAPTRQDRACETPVLTRQDRAREIPVLTHEDRARETPGLTCEDRARETPVPAPAHQDRAREILYSDYSFGTNASFDQHLETRYSTPRQDRAHETLALSLEDPAPVIQDRARETPHSDYSFGSSASFDQHLESRYSTITEEPYVGSVYRRPEGPYTTPGYTTRPDQVQYGGYERGGMGSYYDDMGPRGGGNLRGHHEPGLAGYGPADASLYNNRSSMSAMQRYAPRLDETNHAPRMGNYGRPEPPPPMAGRGMGGYGAPIPGPGFRADSMGFAPGPYNLYSQHNSSGGWLND